MTSADVRAHVAEVEGLTTLAVADLEQVWESLDGAGVTDTRQALVDVLPDLTGVYASAVGLVSVGWYEDLRNAAAVRSSFTASAAPAPTAGQLEQVARWGVAPLVDGDRTGAFARIAGSVERAVRDVDRVTQVRNARRDPAKPRVARDTAAGACAWCAMLATRGAVYRSESTAMAASHDHCKCSPVTVFPGENYQPPDYYARYEDAYEKAVRDLGGARDPKAVLSQMRLTLGSH